MSKTKRGPAAPSEWGPNLYRWLEGYWRAHNTNANAWAAAHPGIQGGTVSRWQTGTQPSLEIFRAVADALDMSLIDVLTIAGVITTDERGGGDIVPPGPPSIDAAIEHDPTLSEVARESLRGMLDGIRRVESREASTVAGRVSGSRRRAGRS